MVIGPSAPVVPGEDDGSVVPESLSGVSRAGGADGILADGVDEGSDPGRTVVSGDTGVIGPGSIGDDPVDAGEIATGDVAENVGAFFLDVDVGVPFFAATDEDAGLVEFRDADTLDGIGSGPDGTGGGSVILPGHGFRIEDAAHGWLRVAETADGICGIDEGGVGDLALFDGVVVEGGAAGSEGAEEWREQFGGRSRGGKAADFDSGGAEIFRDESRVGVFCGGAGRGAAEKELVGGIAWSLIGLVHEVGPTVLLGVSQIRVEEMAGGTVVIRDRRILDIAIGVRALGALADLPGAVVAAGVCVGRIGITHLCEGGMGVVWVSAAGHRNSRERDREDGAGLIRESAGRNVVATGGDGAWRTGVEAAGPDGDGTGGSEEVEEIIGTAILLEDDDHVGDLRRKRRFGRADRGLGDRLGDEACQQWRCENEEKQRAVGAFHVDPPGWVRSSLSKYGSW